MKKEKLTKNELKEKMMKEFDKGIVIAWTIRNFFIIAAVACLLTFMVGIIIELVQSGGGNVIQIAIQVLNDLIVDVNTSDKSNTAFAIGLIIKYSFVVIICDRIGKVFKDSKEAETPFCDANVRNLETISIFAWIYSFILEGFSGYEMAIAAFISVVYYIFKYGCELQEQSDETL